ncbi:DEAD/DEAH box helicase [Crassaminicella indica]|uniref:SNF2 helicase associated domain-containing protein n=1 Tax=Crassaminicella indica TaxID=2855394 RepID=A0ABX8R8S3_9CLOT|nr:DEAD/DEAH box helicase [Crassaminicella indica]QXM05427.1 SNF2 helicase associated domain-containing protein [Crassaminicella indica]
MADIIFVLNRYESERFEKPTIEVFSCIYNKINKNKTFASGQLKNYNFDENQRPQNISEKDFIQIRNLLKDKRNSQIKDHIYALDEEVLIRLLSILCNQKVLYYKSERKGKLYIIDKFSDYLNSYEIRIVYKVLKNNTYKFSVTLEREDRRIMLSTNTVFFTFKKYFFVIFKNRIFFIKQWIDHRFMNNLAKKNWKVSPTFLKNYSNTIKIESKEKIYFRRSVEDYSVVDNIIPKVSFYVKLEEKKLKGLLKFKYDETEIDSYENNEIIIDDINKRKILRDRREENKAIQLLRKNNWKHSRKNLYYCNDHEQFSTTLELFIINGWSIYTQDNRKLKVLRQPNINISSGIDWFDLRINYSYNEEKIALSRLLKHIKKGENWIKLKNGEAILIPESIIKNSKFITKNKKDSDLLRIHKKYIGQVKNLFEEMNVKKQVMEDLESLVFYKDMKVKFDKGFCAQLRDYQLKGIKWLCSLSVNGFGGCLADDMGLGKTLQIIGLLSEQTIKKQKGITVIVVPKTLLFNWKSEILKFNSELKFIIYHGIHRDILREQMKNETDVEIIITTYGTIRNDIDVFKELDLKYLILDEAQAIKNFNAKTYKELNKLNPRNKIILTGTPIENNLKELWGFMDFLNHGLLGSYNKFSKDYINIQQDANKLNKLRNIIGYFILRRMKKDVLKELPPKIEQNIYCEMTDKQKSLYDALKKRISDDLNNLDSYVIKSNAKVLEGLTYLRQVSCHPKLLRKEYNILNCYQSGKFDILKELLKKIKLSGNKVLVFSQFTSMLHIIKKYLISKGWEYSYLDGKTNDREKVIKNFEKSENNNIFLISIKAGGTGINLSSANYVIIYDPWWNPAVENQAIDRAYRIGQKKKVNVYRLITKDSIEEKIMDLKDRKEQLSKKLLDNQDYVFNLTVDELKQLIID